MILHIAKRAITLYAVSLVAGFSVKASLAAYELSVLHLGEISRRSLCAERVKRPPALPMLLV